MNEEEFEENNMQDELYFGIERFRIISKTYQNNFTKCVLLIFDSQTGIINKETFDLGKEITNE